MSRTEAEPSTISVALCTCNGEAYLREQLNSIAAQTRLPDELLVGDDASTDRTREILDDFTAAVPFPVRVESHAVRRGVALNFESAAKRCSGTYIAFCDQDDVWLPGKLARLEASFVAHPEWALVFHDLELVDADLKPMGSTMWQSIGFDAQKQHRWEAGGAFDLLLQRPLVTGAGLMLRRDRLVRVLPFSTGWIHDAWLSLLLSTVDPMGFLPESLAQYRQHGANEVGGTATSTRSYVEETCSMDRRAYYEKQEAVFHELVEQAGHLEGVPEERLRSLESKRLFLQRRSRLSAFRPARLLPVLSGLIRGDYRRYSRGWKVAVRDIMMPP
jgi:glycosyltransferase involved in cell wall biosynthesis